MKRIALLGVAAVTPITLLGVFGVLPPARADVTELSAPPRATIGAETLTVAVTIQVDEGTDGRHRASVWYLYPGDEAATRVARLNTRRDGPIAIRAHLDAARVAFGANRLSVTDDSLSAAGSGAGDDGDDGDGDGDGGQAVTVDTRRRSRAVINRVEQPGDGTVTLAVRISHYDPDQGAYIASRLSPVRLQERVARAWVTRATVTTSTAGTASGTFPAAPGPHTYRAVRPNGATVWSATSATVSTAPDQD